MGAQPVGQEPTLDAERGRSLVEVEGNTLHF
jgi:hypothetical protein